ncbi:MAG: hypothetical protein KKC68_04850 [Candidatus Thermoplasmatota archaeon]|nr:hypothetical protein [Candidatus Thermoplasmatota archaeon]MBU1941081.1 hypothetical protein [Candidatus Thermoplasmatota archaeon]
MTSHFPTSCTILLLIVCYISIVNPLSTGFSTEDNSPSPSYHTILKTCREHVSLQQPNHAYLREYVDVLREHEQIQNVSLHGTCISVEFNDGYYIILLEIDNEPFFNRESLYEPAIFYLQDGGDDTALVLHPFRDVYGSRQCRIITRILKTHGYNPRYMVNDAVDLRFIEQNLSAEIIYMNTHAGYWDINRTLGLETVVIATGEEWTNDTPSTYAFEYSHHFIVEGMIGKRSVIAFTPELIEYYYNESAFNNSLVFMATCDALHDASMASIFISKGAAVYMGWTRDTIFWTNNLASIWVFRLLSLGLSIEQICQIIGSGGVYNTLFRSTLSFMGDGSFRFC